MGLRSIPANKPGSRHFNRLQLGVSASLKLTHEVRSCLIDDISLSGARLRIDRPLAERQSAVLVFHELQLFATVMWCRGAECGLRFEQPLELEDMQGMLWIKENRALYDRICSEGHALAWAEGIEV